LVVGTSESDYAGRLRVLDDAFGRILFDDAGALLAERVAQHAEDLHALGVPALRIAEPAFFDAHRNDAAEGLLVGSGPAERLAKAVDARLFVVGHLAHRSAGAGNHRIDFDRSGSGLRGWALATEHVLERGAGQYSPTSSYSQRSMNQTVHIAGKQRESGLATCFTAATAARSASK
jgi:hypothetical protein